MELLSERNSSSGDESKMSEDLVFPARPQPTGRGAPLTLFSNFYKFSSTKHPRGIVYEYQVTTEPFLSCHSGAEKLKLKQVIQQ